MWNTYKIPLVILGVVAFIAFVLIFARLSANAHARKIEAYARKSGWKYSRQDDREAAKLLDTVFPGQHFFVHDLREVRAKDPLALLLDVRRRDPVNAKHDVSSTGCLLGLSRNSVGLPATFIEPANHVDKVFTSGIVELRDETFAEEYTVSCADPLTAARLVAPEIRRLLLENVRRPEAVPVSFVIHAGYVLALTSHSRDLEDEREMDRLLTLTRALAKAIDAQLEQD